MAFTNVWSNIIPAGSDPANTADDELRQLRLDINERMDQLVEDWTADPLLTLTGIRRTVYWTDGAFQIFGTGTTLSEGYSNSSLKMHPAALTDTINWVIRMNVPVGATLQRVEGRVFRDNATGAVIMRSKRTTNTPTAITFNTQTSTFLAGWHTLVGSALVELAVVDEMLITEFSLTAGTLTDEVGLFSLTYEYDIPFALIGLLQ